MEKTLVFSIPPAAQGFVLALERGKRESYFGDTESAPGAPCTRTRILEKTLVFSIPPAAQGFVLALERGKGEGYFGDTN